MAGGANLAISARPEPGASAPEDIFLWPEASSGPRQIHRLFIFAWHERGAEQARTPMTASEQGAFGLVDIIADRTGGVPFAR